MSFVELRVELPAYSHSFNVQVPCDGTISHVKQEIFRTCPGNPRAESQKLVWRGRYLADDERVKDLWKSHDEPRIVHLAVRPSGWLGAPPGSSTSSAPSEIPHATSDSLPVPPFVYPDPVQHTRASPGHLGNSQSIGSNAMDYIQWKHENAICALLFGWTNPWHSSNDEQLARSSAVSFVQSHGYQWPALLDEEFPAAEPGGVQYERKMIDNLPFLSLVDSTAAPTPFQLHAIKVLSYTFSLISLSAIPSPTARVAPRSIPANVPANAALDVNMLLQQLGLPPLRFQPPQPINNVNQPPNRALRELQEIPVRPLLIPLIFLIFRTCLLLYFVAPARKPVFGMLILAWMLYEIWQPIRNAFHRNLQRAAAAEGQGRPNNANVGRAGDNNAGNVPGAGDRQGQGQQPNVQGPPVAPPANAVPPRVVRVDGESILDALANVNLDAEQQILSTTQGTPMEEPGIWHRVATFVTLLVTTTHPAVWNRRRTALRRREGHLRTEVNLRNRPDEAVQDSEMEGEMRRREARDNAQAQYGRRPEWVRRYIDRVLATDWLDDAD